MPDGNHLVAIDTLLAILLTFLASGRVSQMRGKHGIHAPATIGHPEFERAFRAHANTVENLILYIPLLWMAAFFYGGQLPFWVGLVWIVGRVLYIVGYARTTPANAHPAPISAMRRWPVLRCWPFSACSAFSSSRLRPERRAASRSGRSQPIPQGAPASP